MIDAIGTGGLVLAGIGVVVVLATLYRMRKASQRLRQYRLNVGDGCNPIRID